MINYTFLKEVFMSTFLLSYFSTFGHRGGHRGDRHGVRLCVVYVNSCATGFVCARTLNCAKSLAVSWKSCIFALYMKQKDYSFMINKAQLLMFCSLLLAGCSGDGDGRDVPVSETDKTEIRLAADVWNVMEGTRATTIAGGTLTSGSFTASAYVGNTTTSYINPVQVDYVTDKWVWSDGKHYWPASGNLDFFAYMPATKPTYITTGPTYSAPGTPGVPQASFTCSNMPMIYNATATDPTAGQGSSLQEFIWGITIGQNKANQGASGVTMKFRHPFARIKFQLAANHPAIQINSITFKGLKTGGTCTLDATGKDGNYYTTSVWSSLTPAEGGSDLVMTLASKDGDDKWIAADVNTFNNDPSNTTPIGGWTESAHQFVDLLVIPQTWTGQIEVNASWNDWGDTPVEHTVTATIPATWQPGYSYTYTFNITLEDLVVNLTDFTEQW